VLVRHIGPAAFCPAAGAFAAIAVLFSLTQRGFRNFGARSPGSTAETATRPEA
jgi:hypothetical protein